MSTKEIIKYWSENLFKIGGMIFSAIGAISVLFPLADISRNNFWIRMLMLFLIVLAVLISSVIYTYHNMHLNRRTVYSEDKASIIFEFNDFERIINEKSDRDRTVVIPINTNLEVVGDASKISKTSIHWLLYECLHKNGVELNIDLLRSVTKKRMSNRGESYIGRIGDWFYLTPADLGIQSHLSFLLVEINEYEKKKDGFFAPKALTREDYILGLASALKVIFEIVGQEETVYMPLIGAGNANVGKTEDILLLIEEMLRFYKDKIRQEVHVVIREKDKKEVALYQLREIQ